MGAERASCASRHGGWQAQRSSSGTRATSLVAAIAPIHHRRESACSLDVGLVPAALQRVVGLRPRLVRSLGSGEIRGIAGVPAYSGRTVASASVPRRLSEKKRSPFSDIHHLPVDHASTSPLYVRGPVTLECRSGAHTKPYFKAVRLVPSPPPACPRCLWRGQYV